MYGTGAAPVSGTRAVVDRRCKDVDKWIRLQRQFVGAPTCCHSATNPDVSGLAACLSQNVHRCRCHRPAVRPDIAAVSSDPDSGTSCRRRIYGVIYTNAWFPALRFRSSVQIGSSSIFYVFVRYQAWSSGHSKARETRRPAGPIDNLTRPFADMVRTRHGNGITAKALRNGSADTDCGNGYGYTTPLREISQPHSKTDKGETKADAAGS